jgi:hypothetical protein
MAYEMSKIKGKRPDAMGTKKDPMHKMPGGKMMKDSAMKKSEPVKKMMKKKM